MPTTTIIVIRPLELHAVHLEQPTVTEQACEDDETRALIFREDGTPMMTSRLSDEAAQCPDCGRETVAGRILPYHLECTLVRMGKEQTVDICHEGCMIACGGELVTQEEV